MKKTDDGVPELIVLDERSRRPTEKLCGNAADGLRCTLTPGHVGPHECVAKRGKARWSTTA